MNTITPPQQPIKGTQVIDYLRKLVNYVKAMRVTAGPGLLATQTPNGITLSLGKQTSRNRFLVTPGSGLSVNVSEGSVFFKTLGPYASLDYEDVGPNLGSILSDGMTVGRYDVSQSTVSSIAANDTTAILLKLEYEAVPSPAASTIYQESGGGGPTDEPVEIGLWQHTLAAASIVKDTCTVFDSDISLDTLSNAWAVPSAGTNTVTIYYPLAIVTTGSSGVEEIERKHFGDVHDPYSGHAYLSITFPP